MNDSELELNPVTRIAVGFVGQPGQREFFLQASQGQLTVNLKLEKQQVAALAMGLDELIAELEQRELQLATDQEDSEPGSEGLQEPLDAIFAAGQIGLGYDADSTMMVIVVQELASERSETPGVVRLWGTVAQMRSLSKQAKAVVAQGRPICPLCHQPMDPAGHFCPRRNGHSKEAPQD